MKKGQANQMIAMPVCDEQGNIQRLACVAMQKIVAQPNNATARVQDDGARANFDFNTACVASVTYRARPRCRIAAAHSPEARPETSCIICHAVLLLPQPVKC